MMNDVIWGVVNCIGIPAILIGSVATWKLVERGLNYIFEMKEA